MKVIFISIILFLSLVLIIGAKYMEVLIAKIKEVTEKFDAFVQKNALKVDGLEKRVVELEAEVVDLKTQLDTAVNVSEELSLLDELSAKLDALNV